MRRKRRSTTCKRIALISLLCVCLSGASRAQSTAAPTGDTQLWAEIQTSIRVNPRARLILFGTLRPGRNVTALVDKQVGVGYGVDFARYFTVTQTYRYIASQPTPQQHSREHRLNTDFTVEAPIKDGWSIINRTRAEMRRIEGVHSRRYRNRSQIERRLKFDDGEMTPYLSWEFFYDTRARAWSRERICIGTRLPLSKSLELDAYYAYQPDDILLPHKLHIIVLRLNLDL